MEKLFYVLSSDPETEVDFEKAHKGTPFQLNFNGHHFTYLIGEGFLVTEFGERRLCKTIDEVLFYIMVHCNPTVIDCNYFTSKN